MSRVGRVSVGEVGCRMSLALISWGLRGVGAGMVELSVGCVEGVG